MSSVVIRWTNTITIDKLFNNHQMVSFKKEPGGLQVYKFVFELIHTCPCQITIEFRSRQYLEATRPLGHVLRVRFRFPFRAHILLEWLQVQIKPEYKEILTS